MKEFDDVSTAGELQDALNDVIDEYGKDVEVMSFQGKSIEPVLTSHAEMDPKAEDDVYHILHL